MPALGYSHQLGQSGGPSAAEAILRPVTGDAETNGAPQPTNGRELIRQAHGGALWPGQRHDEPGRNKWGRSGKRGDRAITERLAELIDEGGADGIVRALIAIASDKTHPAAVQATKEILNRLEGPIVRLHEHEHQHSAVEVRKVRLIDGDDDQTT